MAGRRRIRIAPATLNNALSGQAVAAGLASGALAVGGGGSPLFFDDFNYTVAYNASQATKSGQFNSARGYSGFKDNVVSAGALGYLYTASSIPGSGAAIPGASGRILAAPAIAGAGQSDFYLNIAPGGEGVGTLPPDMWIQWWVYINNSGSTGATGNAESTTFAYRSKWMYPQQSPSTATAGEYGWLFVPGADGFESVRETSGNTDSLDPGLPASYPTTEAFLALDTETAVNVNVVEYPTNARKLYQNRNNTVKLTVGQWFLVKQRICVAPGQGQWHAWIRPYGGSFTKVAEWIGGVTPGFTWPCGSQEFTTGYYRMKMPSTEYLNNYKYFADFAIATSEANLPTYGSY